MAQARDPQADLAFIEKQAGINISYLWSKRKFQYLTWYMHNINAGYIWFNTRVDVPLLLSYPGVRNPRSLH